MSAYLKKARLIFPKSIAEKLPARIFLEKDQVHLGNRSQCDVLLDWGIEDGCDVIVYKENQQYFLNPQRISVTINDQPVAGKVRLYHRDQIRIGESYIFYFIDSPDASSLKTQELNPLQKQAKRQKRMKTQKFQNLRRLEKPGATSHIPIQTRSEEAPKLGSLTKRIDQDDVKKKETKTKPKDSSDEEGTISSYRETEMTIAFDSMDVASIKQKKSQLISPSNGQIITLDKDKIVIGRDPDCDLRLMDDYISRHHLEISANQLGFLIKNVGKNDVIIEKKRYRSSAEDKGSFDEVKLRNSDFTIINQQAMIILGDQILYFFSGEDEDEEQEENDRSRLKGRKFNFYRRLAEGKEELLRASLLQKVFTPASNIFDDFKVGFWFKYFALDDLSGDFFLYSKNEESIYFGMGDVSGHGPAAALLASQISGMFKILAERREEPEDIVKCINDQLIKSQVRKLHLYTLLNVFKVDATHLEMCIAGNITPPLYYNAAENKVESLNAPSNPAGVFEPKYFKCHLNKIPFNEGDMIIMFTDGVTEAKKFDGPMIGYPPVQDRIEKYCSENVPFSEYLDTFMTWLVNTCEIEDDLSIVLIGKLPEEKEEKEKKEEKSLLVTQEENKEPEQNEENKAEETKTEMQNESETKEE